MGSGTTGVACKLNRRKFIGIELDKEYYESAVKRFKEVTSQTKLFIPET
jgi:DNA modification methylase